LYYHHPTGIGLCQADAHAFPIFDSSVAGIIEFAVLPHIDRHDGFLSECRRILIRGGILFILNLRTAGEINAFHRSIGEAVANDHLPEAESTAKMLSKHGFLIEINDTDDKYMIIARKL
jgi:ubiquinone/menaquinone biosynthesis C-methylase UbiE